MLLFGKYEIILSFKGFPIRIILVFDFSQQNFYVPIHIVYALAIGCMVGSVCLPGSSVWEIFRSKLAV